MTDQRIAAPRDNSIAVERQSPLLGLVAAHGISPGIAATWHPFLVRTPRVLVPIEVDVLMVRDSKLRWADCGMDAPPDDASNPSDDNTTAASLLSAPFSELATPRPAGAYLQWYLPNSLTSGTADQSSSKANYPAIPDRWLVTRVSQGGGPRLTYRSWVLEAGGHPPVVSDLAGWSEPGPATNVQNPLTALGHGNVSWAGYFDAVENRLAFYDGSLEQDGINGLVSYVVCGWYEDPTLDPLGASTVTSLAAFNAALKAFGWMLEFGDLKEVVTNRSNYLLVTASIGLKAVRDSRLESSGSSGALYTTDGSWWPTATLYHGAVVGIDWSRNSDTVELGGPPDPSTVSVAIGNTMAEAMGSLVALANGKPTEAAIVEALELGVVKELDKADGRAQLDVQLHTASFQAWPGEPAITELVTIAPSGPPTASPSNPPTPGPGIFTPPASTSPSPASSRTFSDIEVAVNRADLESHLFVTGGTSGVVRAEEKLVVGGLASVIAKLGIGAKVPSTDPGGVFDAARAQPRLFTPRDPVLLVLGGKRSFSHDSTVPTLGGAIVCRLSTVNELSYQMPKTDFRFAVRGEDLVEGPLGNGSIPIECDAIVREAVVLSPTSSSAIVSATSAAAKTVAGFDEGIARQNIAVEQTAWYSLRNPMIDHGALLANTGLSGVLPAPIAISPPSRPWTPVHLDWQIEFLPSPGGITDWSLDQVDYVLGDNSVVPDAGTGTLFSGRSPLTGGASNALSTAIASAIKQAAAMGGTGPVPTSGIERAFSQDSVDLIARYQRLGLVTGANKAAKVPAAVSIPTDTAQTGDQTGDGADSTILGDVATAIGQMDVLSCGLSGMLDLLRGAEQGNSKPTGAPTGFVALRSGFLRIVRLRMVDGFGQFVDLLGSDETHAATGMVISEPMTVPGQPDIVGLPPRFTARTRASFRFMDADNPEVEASATTSPVCGFLMPDHLDGSLEFFTPEGISAGSLQPTASGRVEWLDAPGTPSTTGQSPAAVLTSPFAAQFAQSLIDWGIGDAADTDREPALSALLRTIDSTLWSVDPFGHAGDEHLSLLLGHPVCLLRANIRLDVVDSVDSEDATLTAVPIRLGDLTQWQDGLLGYFVNDDYSVLHVADSAAPAMARQFGPGSGFLQQINLVQPFYDSFANDLPDGAIAGSTPVVHPYVDTSGIVMIRPNQTIALTLLVSPLTSVHLTAGLVPRKEIGMRREWVQAGLAAIAPTFRFGPVLVDPQHIRMPLATDLNGKWVWDARATATTWAENPATNATDNALLGSDPPTATEGWLRLNPPPTATT